VPYSNIDIINQGLGKFSSSKVSSIVPPHSSLERHCTGYNQWKESELCSGGRRWVFATVHDYDLPQTGYYEGKDRPYEYTLPDTVLRPIRDKYATWRQSQRKIFSVDEDLTIPVVLNVPEADFDPLFIDVLACRVWLECNDFVRQSHTGYDEALAAHQQAIAMAARSNAFTIGPEDVNDDDTAFDYITGRW
jgi:hypothetical protein